MAQRTESARDGGRSGVGRRQLIKAVGGGAGLVALSGCLNSVTGGGGGNDLADTLVIQMEGGSMLEALKQNAFDQFEEEFGTSVEVSLRSSQQSGYAKIKAGQAEVDMASVPPFTIYNGTKEGLWEPIPEGDLPENYHSNVLDPLKNPIFDPGEEVHALPHAYGTVGMAYNKNQVDDPSTWGACWNEDYEGHVSMEGFGFIRVFTTALYLGMDPNDIQMDGSYEKGIEKIWETVKEQQDLVITNWTSGDEQGRLFSSKDAWVGEGWGNVIYSAVQDGNDHISYNIPDEGAYGYTQNHALVQGISEQKKQTALEFINFLLRDEILRPTTEQLGLPPATDVTSEQIKNLYDYDPKGGEGLKFPDVGYINEHNDEWSQRWEEVRSS